MSPEGMTLATTVFFWLILTCAVIGTVFVVNKRKSPRPLPLEKPSLALFPKYYFNLPSSDGQAEGLAKLMEQKGFRDWRMIPKFECECLL